MSAGRILFVVAAVFFILAAVGVTHLGLLGLVPLGWFCVALGLAVG